MNNIEEDIKMMKEFLSIDRKIRNNEVKSDYEKFCERRCIAIENILSEREQDKTRIKELEEENKRKQILLVCAEEIIEESIPKQKIKDKIEELKRQRRELGFKTYLRKEDIINDDREKVIKIQILEKLLQESEDK